ncbi:DUF6168 family protein [Cellulophaga sp. Hel_I_12]|uniref:DUF6168 family protein n=1 Tax=Cellulophaga sp. Hel_I_12 TaxID=1249972 RepID=UPI0035100881
MVKAILIYSIVFTCLFFGGQYLQHFYFASSNVALSQAIENVYLFHFFFSLVICIIFLVLSNISKFKDQLGFIYLANLLLKIFFFVILFQNLIFTEMIMTKLERISLLIPVVLFLSFEVFFISRILRKV